MLSWTIRESRIDETLCNLVHPRTLISVFRNFQSISWELRPNHQLPEKLTLWRWRCGRKLRPSNFFNLYSMCIYGLVYHPGNNFAPTVYRRHNNCSSLFIPALVLGIQSLWLFILLIKLLLVLRDFVGLASIEFSSYINLTD